MISVHKKVQTSSRRIELFFSEPLESSGLQFLRGNTYKELGDVSAWYTLLLLCLWSIRQSKSIWVVLRSQERVSGWL